MSLKTKNNNLPDEFTETKQVTFNDLEFEAEYLTDEELEELSKPITYLTISGKEQDYNPDWTKYGMRDLEVGDEFESRPEITIFENDEKTYNAMRLRIMDDGEILNLYMNYPKKDYPYVKNINKGFDFYRTCFDFIYSVLRYRGEQYIVDENGEEINRFNKVNLENFAKFVDQKDRVGVKITKGNRKYIENEDGEEELEDGYNSWIIYKME